MQICDADIFIEVEGGDARPIDIRRRNERFQEFELADAGREHDRRRPLLVDRGTQCAKTCLRGCGAKGTLVGAQTNVHRFPIG